MSVGTGKWINPTDIAALFATANGKASLPGRPYTIPDAGLWPQWDASTQYGGGSQVRWSGGLFISLASGNTMPPSNTTYWKGETNQGAYDNTVTYHLLDVVSYPGGNWVSTTTQTGNPPLQADNVTPNAGWMQHWLSAYNRLRGNLQTAANENWPAIGGPIQTTAFQQAVSGPWPVIPSINYNNLRFIYPLVPGNPTAQITLGQTWGPFPNNGIVSAQVGEIVSYSFSSMTYTGFAGYGFSVEQIPTSATLTLTIGGTENVTITGNFIVTWGVSQGSVPVETDGEYDTSASDGTDPLALCTLDASGWFGGSWSSPAFAPGMANPMAPGGFEIVQSICTVSGVSVAPGVYTLVVHGSMGSGASITYSPGNGGGVSAPSISACCPQYNSEGIFTTGLTVGWSSTAATPVAGIHNLYPVYAIAAPPFNPVTGLPLGICYHQELGPWLPIPSWETEIGTAGWVDQGFYGYIGWPAGSPPAAFSNPPSFYNNSPMISAGVNFSATVPGVWTGQIPPTGALTMSVQGEMPWNQFCVNVEGNVVNPPWPPPPYIGGEAYTNRLPAQAYNGILEIQTVPNQWNPATNYPLGYFIVDSNGNWQQVVAAGYSNDTTPPQPGGRPVQFEVPVWATTIGGLTSEYPPPWVRGIGGVSWRMIPQPGGTKFQSAKPRMYSTPCYPVLKSTDVWKPITFYALGALILDANGDVRICTTAGNSGTRKPGWSLGSIATVYDGTAAWNFYLQNTGPDGNGGGTGSGGFSGTWSTGGNCGWIHSVNVNRISGVAGTTTCQIGCIRAGSFVSFGTFTTGTATEVLWPIFTNTPLVYVCAERLDVQASFFTNQPTPWGAIGWPLLADYYQDMVSILNLIV